MFSENLTQIIKRKESGLKLTFHLSNLTVVVLAGLSFFLPKHEVTNLYLLPILVIVGFTIAIVNFFIFKLAGANKCLKCIHDKTKFKEENLSEDDKKEKRILNVINNYCQSLIVNAALNDVVAVFGFVIALYSVSVTPASIVLWLYAIILNSYMWPKLERFLKKFIEKLDA